MVPASDLYLYQIIIWVNKFKNKIQIWKSKQLVIKSKSMPNTTKNKTPKDLSGK